MRNPELWERLQEHCFATIGGTGAFPHRLEREANWSPVYTARVVEEYRRFLYLNEISGGAAHPSDSVNRAWNTHLSFAHDYWENLCGDTLGHPVHKETPAKVTRRERVQYADTLWLYREEFGVAPPKGIWPKALKSRLKTLWTVLAYSGVLAVVAGAAAAYSLGNWEVWPLPAAGLTAMLLGHIMSGQAFRPRYIAT